jgi:hypothetical protein
MGGHNYISQGCLIQCANLTHFWNYTTRHQFDIIGKYIDYTRIFYTVGYSSTRYVVSCFFMSYQHSVSANIQLLIFLSTTLPRFGGNGRNKQITIFRYVMARSLLGRVLQKRSYPYTKLHGVTQEKPVTFRLSPR